MSYCQRWIPERAKPMKQHSMEERTQEGWFKSGITPDQYYSVEFSLAGHDCPYQFKIWTVEPASMYVLVKEDSKILECLKVGDVVKPKYYTTDSLNPTRHLNTRIKCITKEDQGRFKGHFLVGLSILEELSKGTTH
jgi:hypothetical protein